MVEGELNRWIFRTLLGGIKFKYRWTLGNIDAENAFATNLCRREL